MAMKLRIPGKYVTLKEDHCGPMIIIDESMMTWLKDKAVLHTFNHTVSVDPHTFEMVPLVGISIDDDDNALQFKLTWL
jgi:hypothetical protein